MKKFLFTLAALLMAGTAFADNYLYIDDIELTKEFVEQTSNKARRIQVPVKAHFDQWTNAWDVTFDYGDITCRGAVVDDEGNLVAPDMVLTGMNKSGSTVKVTVALNASENADHFIAANAVGGYYYPEGSDPDEDDPVLYGAIKWAPGEYECMFVIELQIPQNFEGGDISILSVVASGADARPDVETAPKNVSYTHVAHVTVEGGAAPEITETPVITYNEETYTVTATGNGEVKLYVNGEEVENPYTFEQTEEEVTYTVTATAQEAGKEISETATATIVVPAKVVVPEVTEKPVITWTVDNEAETVTITATGNGTVILYNDDVEVARGEGVATYVVPFTEDPEGEEMGFSATAQEDGKEVSEYALATVEIPGKQPVVPEVTEAPVINVEVTDDAYIITATGEGTVVLYVNDEPVENPYTIARGEEDQTIYVYATAQEEGKEMGTTDVEPIVVEAKAGETPVDPHMTGYWIVTIDKNGNEVWKELLPDNGDYTGIVRFEYADYGTFPYDPNKTEEENNAMRPNVEYYVYVDGVRYGAAEDGTLTVLGEALNNPLFEGENNYVLANASGRVYNMGVAIDNATNSMYVYAAVAYYTDVNEMNADKAVAGVRYFNMAGQEMQEANGMTIVVTTYTDGTTSAVKVMK